MTLILLLATYGLTFFIVDSYIMKIPRDYLCRVIFFRELLTCYFCQGFWVALFLSVISQGPRLLQINSVYSIQTHLINGFAGATFAYITNAVIEALESYRDRRP